jgi:hypothetical protein
MAGITGTSVSAEASDPPPSAPGPAPARVLVQLALLSALASGLLVIGAVSGRFVLAALLVPLQVLLLLSWLAALSAPGLVWSAAVAGGSAVAADFLLATGPNGVRRLAGTIGVALLVAMLVALLRQLLRQPAGDAGGLVSALAATVSAVVVVCAMAVIVALRRSNVGEHAAEAGLVGTAGALFVARVVDAIRLRRKPGALRRRSVGGLLVGGAVAVGLGAAVGAPASGLGVGDGIALATSAAVVALAADIGLDLARRGLAPGPELDRVRAALLPLAVLLPVAVAVPAAYVTGRVLLG